MPDNTIVKTVDFEDIDSYFDGVTTEEVITPEVKPVTVLTPEQEADLDPLSLAKKAAEVKVTPDAAAAAKPEEGTPAAEATPDADLNFDDIINQGEDQNKAAGRAKTDKSGIVEIYKKNIVDGKMVPFNDFDVESTDPQYAEKLEEYLSKLSMKDMEELWEANLTAKEEKLQETVPQEFYNSLPRELQFAAKYVADGGTDMKGLFKALSQVEEVRTLDPEKDAREVALQYLKATNFGNDEEIKEQLDEWEDLGTATLVKKAQAFKPKLDKMQEQIVERQLAEQAEQKELRIQAAEAYQTNVQEALKVPELAGVKLDKKTHEFLTQGLLQPAYQSVSGKKTNLLGYLLEQHQMVKPNYPLVAEALWLLSDPDAYRAKLMEKGKTANVVETVRQLKGEQNRRSTSTSIADDAANDQRSKKTVGVPRPGSVLKR